MKKTIVIGASQKEERYSNRAVKELVAHNIPVVAIGLREGEIDGIKIQTGFPKVEDVDTVTLYVREKNQPHYYDYILSLKPKRVIFNPGAENMELRETLIKAGIEAPEACTLVMLSIGSY